MTLDGAFGSIVVLQDEDGNEISYMFLDVIVYQNKEYLLLMRAEEDDDSSVTVFEIMFDGDDELYKGVQDEKLAEEVFNIFKARKKDKYKFSD